MEAIIYKQDLWELLVHAYAWGNLVVQEAWLCQLWKVAECASEFEALWYVGQVYGNESWGFTACLTKTYGSGNFIWLLSHIWSRLLKTSCILFTMYSFAFLFIIFVLNFPWNGRLFFFFLGEGQTFWLIGVLWTI